MARFTLTQTAQLIASGAAESGQSDAASRFFGILPQVATGTVLLEPGTLSAAPSMAAAARWDLAKLTAVDYVCEPGRGLWATCAAATIDVDVLQGGER